MRDLEIRGAGNILGTEQSGHIAAVGYELYCKLLEQAVRLLKQLPPAKSVEVDIDLPTRAYIPRKYVPDMRAKIDLYRRLARVASHADLADFRSELNDRFGPPPAPLEEMLALAELRIAAHQWGIRSIHLEDGYAVFRYGNPERIKELAAQSGRRLRVVDAQSAYLPLANESRDPAMVREAVKSLLQPDTHSGYNPAPG
ncbi:MAG TPA: hypothetical protein DD670_10220 [Planctomycetaceae bacterium]|nr:hypothetical protein [Planctomycetaceae bacterium]